METRHYISMAFLNWIIEERNSKDAILKLVPDYEDSSCIAKMIRSKFKVLRIPLDIPDYLLAIIEMCTNYNPGVSQVMLKEILSNIKDLKQNYSITTEDFSRTYEEFPIVDNPKWESHFNELWDKQKSSDGSNLCDTREWWMEVFK